MRTMARVAEPCWTRGIVMATVQPSSALVLGANTSTAAVIATHTTRAMDWRNLHQADVIPCDLCTQ